jgi:cell division protein FtsB
LHLAKKGGTIRGLTEIPLKPPEEFTMNKKAQARKRQSAKVWIKVAVLLVIIFSTVALLTTYVYISHLRETNKDLQQQAAELEQHNQDLQNYIDHNGTDEGVKDVATGELGMVDPDTVIYDFD